MQTLLVNLAYIITIASYLPVYRFRKTDYYWFFLTWANLNLLIILISKFFHLHAYYYMPFVPGAMLLALPGLKWKSIVDFFLFIALILVSFYKESNWIPLLFTSPLSFYILYYFSQIIFDAYKKDFAVRLFLPVLWVESLKDVLLVYLYFCHFNLFIRFFIAFSVIAFISPLLITYFGINKKYYFKKKLGANKNRAENPELPVQQGIPPADNITGQVIEVAEPEREIPKDVTKSEDEVEIFLNGLKEREIVILYYLSQGFDEQEISDKIALGIKSIYTYIAKLKEKLNIKTMAKLYYFAITNGKKISKTSIIQKYNSR